jgi:hypothetical protein
MSQIGIEMSHIIDKFEPEEIFAAGVAIGLLAMFVIEQLLAR